MGLRGESSKGFRIKGALSWLMGSEHKGSLKCRGLQPATRDTQKPLCNSIFLLVSWQSQLAKRTNRADYNKEKPI